MDLSPYSIPTWINCFCTSYLGSDGTDKALTVQAVQDSVYYISLSSDTLSIHPTPNYIVNAADSSMSGNNWSLDREVFGFSLLDFGTYVGGTSDDIINDFRVLSDSDVVLPEASKNITEVNETIANGSGTDALYGGINVSFSRPGDILIYSINSAAAEQIMHGAY